MPTKYPTLDGISSFVANGTTVTATVTYCFYYAPDYVYYVNTYIVGEQLNIAGAEHAANNGVYEITGFTGNTVGSPTGTITYKNASGVTAATQFALCSPAPILVTPTTGAITVSVAQPFSYLYAASTGWNPPRSYSSSIYPTVTYTGTCSVTNSGTTRITTTATGSFTNVQFLYQTYYPDDIVPYRQTPSFTIPVIPTALTDNGSALQLSVYTTRLSIFTRYAVTQPRGLAYDSVNGYLYVADYGANVIRRVTLSTGTIITLAGNGANYDLEGYGTSAGFSGPDGLVLQTIDGVPYLIVTCFWGSCVSAIDLTTLYVTWWATPGSGDVNRPSAIVSDSSRNCYYIACGDGYGIIKMTRFPTTTFTTLALTPPVTYPQNLAINSACTILYATSASDNKIYAINLAANTTSVVAGSGATAETDGTGAGAAFNRPRGITLDEPNSCLYVVTSGGNKLRKVTLAGVVTTVAGSGTAAETDGTGASASFNAPYSVVLGATNTLYVGDDIGQTLRKVNLATSPATVSTNVSTVISSGYNAIEILGTVYIYNSPPTITFIPGLATAVIRYTGSDGIPHDSAPFVYPANDFTPSLTFTTSTPMTSVVFDTYMPYAITGYTGSETPVVRCITASTSPELVPFISAGRGPNDPTLLLESTSGFTYVPALQPLYYRLVLSSDYTGIVFANYTNNFTVTGIQLTVTPMIESPLQLYTYAPFSYVFTIPSSLVDVTLDTSATDLSLAPYITLSEYNTVATFASTQPITPVIAKLLRVRAYLYDSSVIQASNETLVTISATGVVVTPTILSGVTLNLYKYEPFSYVFSILGTASTLTLRYTRSSSQLSVYSTLSSDGRTFTFAGTPPASYSSTFSLVVDLMDGTTVVSTTTYPVTISAGRITFVPASPFALYQYENVSNTFGSNITWSSSNAPDSLVSVPTLPVGLSFSNFYLVGTPQVQQAQRNYQIIGSNSSNGSISTANIAISVGPPIVRITPSAASFTGLGLGSLVAASFTALVPSTIYSSNFVYTWSPSLPSGMFFTDVSNNPLLSSPFYPTDSNKTIKLSGGPDMTDARSFPSSGTIVVTLAGTYKDATNVQTIGTSTLTLQFLETVLLTANASSALYVGKALGSNDVTFTAASYFPFTSPISNVSVTDLPAGLSLARSGNTWYLTGTPTVAGTTTGTWTATNYNAITNSTPYSITINADVVTFSSTPPSPTFTVSRPLDSNSFQVQASATSGTTITYTSSVSLPLYGLSLDSSTGAVTGTPTSTFLNTVIFTARDSLGASNTYTVLFRILEDTFTWPAYAPTYFQNRTIDPYQIVVTTASGRAIQSFSSTNMPAGLTLSPSGLITGAPAVSMGGTFTITATTGYQAPSTASKTYTYSIIADRLLVVQVNGNDRISTVFSNVPFVTLQYSSATSVTPVYSVLNVTPIPAPVLTMSASGMLSGDFTGVNQSLTYTADIQAVYAGITGTTRITMSSGTLFTALGPLTFAQPSQSTLTLYQYVPYTVPVQAIGASGFIYYYALDVPVGFQFTPDTAGTTASLAGISPSNGTSTVTFYAQNASSAASATQVRINTVIPYFAHPQSGAAAYTAILREHVDADAAQNARDNRTFPQVDPLAGPFMGPRAPDVITQSNCFLKLCKKPCPSCRSTL